MLEIRNKTVRHGAVTALDDVSLAVPDGARVALVGPNGAGKTTLLRALAGPGTALVPQTLPADVPLTCREFVMLGRTPKLSPWRAPSRADEAAVARALADADAEGFAGRRLDALSGGECQRAALALALATEAPVLLLDEPAAHLDFVHRDELFALLARLGKTVVMALHELPFGSDFFTRAVLLSRGRIVADDTPARALTPENLSAAWGVPVTVETALRARTSLTAPGRGGGR